MFLLYWLVTRVTAVLAVLFVVWLLFVLVICFLFEDQTEEYADKKSLGKHVFLLQEGTQQVDWTGDASHLEMKTSLQWPDGTIELIDTYHGELYEQFYNHTVHEAAVESWRGRYYLRLDEQVWSRPSRGGTWKKGVPVEWHSCNFERWNLKKGTLVLDEFPDQIHWRGIKVRVFRLNPKTGNWNPDERASHQLTRAAQQKSKHHRLRR